jgi:Smg protein
MFDILMYLFENFVHSDVELLIDQDELTDELVRAGFDQAEIMKAISWLEKLVAIQESDVSTYLYGSTANAIRVYSDMEKEKIDVSTRGFLLFLEQASILTVKTREMVIERVLELDTQEQLTLEDVKWVILMVLFNVPDGEKAYGHMEDLLFELPDSRIH